MTRGAKMLLMARQTDENRRNGSEGHAHPRDNYNWHEMRYGDTEARFRDRTGREHYDNGRFAPKNEMVEPEGNYGPDSRRYRRDDAGRFRSEYPYPPLVPPVYREGSMNMNRIGFAADGDRELTHDYRADAAYNHMDEMGHRTSATTMGHAEGSSTRLTEEMAQEWMHGLQNEDGTKGPHWTQDQVKQVVTQKGLKVEPLEFWVVLNALYSDYCAVFKKHGVNNMDLYIDLACAWINDKDAQGGKTARYFQHIAK